MKIYENEISELKRFLDKFMSLNHRLFEFTDEPVEVNDNTLNEWRENIKEGKGFRISLSFSESSILGTEYNAYLRAWHDYTHATSNLGFDLVSELLVCSLQCRELSKLASSTAVELLRADLAGQSIYHEIHGEFIKNQKEFVKDYMINPTCVFKKY